jgi:hypothetical protein
MIGVTIGVGPLHHKLATLAAMCLKKHTGLDSIILNSKHYADSGLPHPAALKLRIFDLLRDNHILYYDSDWFCVNRWNPEQFARNARLVACHDFVLNADWPDQLHDPSSTQFNGPETGTFVTTFEGNVRSDYVDSIRRSAGLELKYPYWINTGLFIANRANHTAWLKKAESFYTESSGHHPKYYEQPAMLKAMHALSIRVDYLPRKFNYLLTRHNPCPKNAVGLHIKMSKTREFAGLAKAIWDDSMTPDLLEKAFFDGSSVIGTLPPTRDWHAPYDDGNEKTGR